MTIELGSNDIPRTVAFQHDAIMMWVDVRRDSFQTKMINRYFDIFTTGYSDIPADAVLVGTAFRGDGYVLHIFEVFPDSEQS